VRVELIDDVELFASIAGAFLASDEANHTVLLSALQAALQAQAGGEPLPEGWFGAVVVDGSAVVAAARQWRGTWVMTTGPTEALQALGRFAVRQGAFKGFVGPAPSVQAFEQGSGLAAHMHTELPLMQLQGAPVLPKPVEGRLRVATLDDLALLRDWHEAFRIEARIDMSAEQVATDAERNARAGTQYLWLHPDGSAVGWVGGRTIAPSGARIGPVYTPPALRGRGIGGAMVVTLTQRFLDAGARCVFLFTDAANPTSNALYQRIGFAPIGRHLHLMVARQ
jgi:predicted GNAT family acetyltransferase